MILNQRSWNLIHHHRAHWHELQVNEQVLENGCCLLDFGTRHSGNLGGGLLLARICLADLAQVSLARFELSGWNLPAVQVTSDLPLLACMAAQYAGWQVQSDHFYAMGSGPARLLRGGESVLDQYALKESAQVGVLVLESSRLPEQPLLEKLSAECGLDPSQLTVCVARTASLPGSIQIVARSIETTLHKLFELEFPLRSIVSATGQAPLPPVGKHDLQSIGWTNDAILYGAQVTLWVDCDDRDIERVLPQLPSNTSVDFGRPFLEIFESYNRDFYQVDKSLFSPACVMFNNLRTGRLWRSGEVHEGILRKSFGLT